MGLFNKAGKFLVKRVGQPYMKGMGKVANFAGDVASATGQKGIATALKGAGSVYSDVGAGNTDLGDIAKGAAVDAGKTYVIGSLAGKLGGVFGRGGNAADATAQGSSGNIAGMELPEAGTEGGGMGKLGKVGGFFGKYGDDILKWGSAAGDAYGAYTSAKDRDRYRRLAEAEYARRAPLRDRSQQMLLDDSVPDLSATFADPMDPAGRYRRVNVGSRG